MCPFVRVRRPPQPFFMIKMDVVPFDAAPRPGMGLWFESGPEHMACPNWGSGSVPSPAPSVPPLGYLLGVQR